MPTTIAQPQGSVQAQARAAFAAAGLCGQAPPYAPKPAPHGALSAMHHHGRFDACKKPARKGAQSTYSGIAVTTTIDRTLVEAILPAGLELAQPADPARTWHPVVHLLGLQDEPRGLLNGQLQQIPGAKPYYELILLVPFTVRSGSDCWHSYSARMYLDDLAAIGIGDAAYAYGKEWGDFDFFGTSVEVRSQGPTMFESETTETGGWSSAAGPAGLPPGFIDLASLLQMPVIGHNALLGFVCSYFEWDLSQAEFAPLTSVHRFVNEFLPGMQPWVALGDLAGAAEAAYRLRKVRWRLAFPPAGCT